MTSDPQESKNARKTASTNTQTPLFYGVRASLPSALLFLFPILLFIAFFYPSFSSNARFSYRDEAFYYYPLFEQIQREWERGRLPLWNANENLGQPLAADPTASVFYPGKALFFLSSFGLVDYALCFKLYIWLHIVLAFLLSYRLLRKLRISQLGSVLGATAYTFSGQTLFQYSNIVYLIGAAWAPGLFYYAVDIFKHSSLRSLFKTTFKLSVVQAITILGGEPQIVYLTMLVTTFALLLKGTPSIMNADLASRYSRFRRRLTRTIVFIVLTSALTFCIAAIQILPSLEAIAHSSRTSSQNVYSFWDVPKALLFSKKDRSHDSSNLSYSGLIGADFSQNGRSVSIYRFSVGPWRWLEFAFPNVGGKQFPRASRWFETLPEEISVWTPTLYCGAFPFLLALSAFRFKNRKQENKDFTQVFFTWLTILSLLTALGGFGLVWFCRAIGATFTSHTWTHNFMDRDPVGGLYWILNVTIPMFAQFRYPAKLLTLTVLGGSCLVGFGWDRVRYSRRFQYLSSAILIASLLGLVLVLSFGQNCFSSLSLSDPLFGKFQPALAYKAVTFSFVQTFVIVSLTSGILFFLRKNERSRRARTYYLLTISLLLITSVDIFIANGWTIVVSPTSAFSHRSSFLTQIENERAEKSPTLSGLTLDAFPPTRFYRFPVWFPPLFEERSSSKRNAERVVWDVETLFPKYGLNEGLAALDVRGAITEAEYFRYVQSLIQKTNVDADLGFLGVSYVIGPRFWTERLLDASQIDVESLDCGPALKKVRSPAVRAAIFQNGQRVDAPFLRAYYRDTTSISARFEDNIVEPISYEPNKIVYLVRVSKDSEVVFAEQYWNDWHAEMYALDLENAQLLAEAKYNANAVSSILRVLEPPKKIPIECAYDFLRKIRTSAGIYCVVMEYRPTLLRFGALVSLLSWLLLLGLYLHSRKRAIKKGAWYKRLEFKKK